MKFLKPKNKKFHLQRGMALSVATMMILIGLSTLLIMTKFAVKDSRRLVQYQTIVKGNSRAETAANEALADLAFRIEKFKEQIRGNITETNLDRYAAEGFPAEMFTDWGNSDKIAEVPADRDFVVIEDGKTAMYEIADLELASATIFLRVEQGYGYDPNYSNNWARFYFSYEIVAEDLETEGRKKIRLASTSPIEIQFQRTLSRYNYFTNNNYLPDGVTKVWNSTSYTGLVHTNDTYFVDNSDGMEPVFADRVTIADAAPVPGYEKRDGSSSYELKWDGSNDPEIVPVIPIPQGVAESAMADTALQGEPEPVDDGLYSYHESSATIYVMGDAKIWVELESSTTNHYTIEDENDVTHEWYQNVEEQITQLIYVNGGIKGLSGTISDGSQITIAANKGIKISGDLKYENYPHSQTVLGVVSWTQDILVKKDLASSVVTIHGSLMAPEGGFGAEGWENFEGNYTSIGTIRHRGGLVIDHPLPSFLKVSETDYRGFQIDSEYDEALKKRKAPPFFPGNGDYEIIAEEDFRVVDRYKIVN